jgi:excisionase family DNA binding protein
MFDEAKFRLMIREEIRRALSEAGSGLAWLSQQEAADHCDVSVATIRNWHRQGLKFQRVGRVARYERAELDAFMKRGSNLSIDERVALVLRKAS